VNRPERVQGPLHALPIRLRLAVWCASILAVGLFCCSTLVYLVADHALQAAGDDQLASRIRRIDAALGSSPTTADPQMLGRVRAIFSPASIDFVLLTRQGQALLQTPLLSPALLEQARRRLPATNHFYNQVVDGEPFRAYLSRWTGEGPVAYVLVVHSVEDTITTLATLRYLLLAGDLLCLAGVSAAAWLLAGRALAPITTVTSAAAAIARSANPEHRVPAPRRQDEVGRLVATFNLMLDSLEASQRALKRFVSDASHELRTPLTSMRGNADLLVLAPDLPLEERVATAWDISEEAAWLSRLVEGLLALAVGDARLPFQPQPVALHDLLASTCRGWARRSGPLVQLGACDPAVILADPRRLRQLLTILLDNATKYTPPEGSVLCALRTTAQCVVLTVQDTGPGIQPRDLPHIFERFYRATHSRSGAQAGVGLGLAIAQQIVEEAGGAISVASEVGRGATFMVRLPRLLTAPVPEDDR
jgi:two-component system OmpR family sensor kinase